MLRVLQVSPPLSTTIIAYVTFRFGRICRGLILLYFRPRCSDRIKLLTLQWRANFDIRAYIKRLNNGRRCYLVGSGSFRYFRGCISHSWTSQSFPFECRIAAKEFVRLWEYQIAEGPLETKFDETWS